MPPNYSGIIKFGGGNEKFKQTQQQRIVMNLWSFGLARAIWRKE